ncbi:hypothetical protein GUJ93_ZPchr0010g7768 [Zizania palustris]|uniref:Uncharacterized protein n=1 Tax=Zizania palustris TaxID=103762 RepID=A0A8J5TBQ0_ZIZPA|nr:hypothetical protein GUJ93_ZPchr0010g7768 [Zizania palustris]
MGRDDVRRPAGDDGRPASGRSAGDGRTGAGHKAVAGSGRDRIGVRRPGRWRGPEAGGGAGARRAAAWARGGWLGRREAAGERRAAGGRGGGAGQRRVVAAAWAGRGRRRRVWARTRS